MYQPTAEQRLALLVLHCPMAQAGGMVYEVWSDGEVTLTKGGDLYRQRGLHTVRGGSPSREWDGLAFPIQGNNGAGAIMVAKQSHAIAAHNLILNAVK